MKWPKKQLDIMQDGFTQVIESFGGAEIINREYHDKPASYIWYGLHRIVSYDLQFSNEHPAYHETEQDGTVYPARVRRCKYNPEFELYPNGCNDCHLKTALKFIAGNLGIKTK